VRVLGPKEKAEKVREMYIKRGKDVSKLFPDKYEKMWWYFYVDN